eukprot:1125518-Rhodomonas_salina.1
MALPGRVRAARVPRTSGLGPRQGEMNWCLRETIECLVNSSACFALGGRTETGIEVNQCPSELGLCAKPVIVSAKWRSAWAKNQAVCPVLSSCMLPAAMMSCTELAHGTTSLCDVRVWYYQPTRCPVLTQRIVLPAYAMSGTDVACGTTRVSISVAEARKHEGRAPLSAYARATRCPRKVLSAYAVSGTDMLRVCYAKSGTDRGYTLPGARGERPRAVPLIMLEVLSASERARRCLVLICTVP